MEAYRPGGGWGVRLSPQQVAVSSARRAQANRPPTDTSRKRPGGGVPSRRDPGGRVQHASARSCRRTPHVALEPALIEASGVAGGRCAACFEVKPQHTARPDRRSPQACHQLALTDVNRPPGVRRSEGEPEPQHVAVRESRSPQSCPAPTLSCVSPPGGAAAVRRLPFDPQQTGRPAADSPQLSAPRATSCVNRPAGGSLCPAVLMPQHAARPSPVSAQLCPVPAATCVNAAGACAAPASGAGNPMASAKATKAARNSGISFSPGSACRSARH